MRCYIPCYSQLGQLLTERLQRFLPCQRPDPSTNLYATVSLAVYLRHCVNAIFRRPWFNCSGPPSTDPLWGRVFPDLHTGYNIYYEGFSNPHLLHHCPFPNCNLYIHAADIRQHLHNFHLGYSQRPNLQLKCTHSACAGAEYLAAKSYPKHVLEHHCVIRFLCPYCGASFSRSQSVTRHFMLLGGCNAFAAFRRHVPELHGSQSS